MILIISIPVAQTFDSPPFKREGALSPLARIDSKLKTFAISLCHNSEIGLIFQSKCERFSKKCFRFVPTYQPTAANIASLPCFISASRIQNKVFADFAKPRGSKPTSPAREPSKVNGAFTPPMGSHLAGRATFFFGAGGISGLISNEEVVSLREDACV
jgi:hypothetical protein